MTTAEKSGVRIFGTQVVDLMAQIADDVLESHDDLVAFREPLFQPHENRIPWLTRRRSCDGRDH